MLAPTVAVLLVPDIWRLRRQDAPSEWSPPQHERLPI
jgi:hypothetical protein